MRVFQTFLICLLIGVIAVAGYAAMHLPVYALPLEGDHGWAQFLFTAFVIALGLAVPYWMLKIGLHHAHKKNPQEKELRMRDIPKDQRKMTPGQ